MTYSSTYENDKIGKITFGYLHYGDSVLIFKITNMELY